MISFKRRRRRREKKQQILITLQSKWQREQNHKHKKKTDQQNEHWTPISNNIFIFQRIQAYNQQTIQTVFIFLSCSFGRPLPLRMRLNSRFKMLYEMKWTKYEKKQHKLKTKKAEKSKSVAKQVQRLNRKSTHEQISMCRMEWQSFFFSFDNHSKSLDVGFMSVL